MPPPAPEPMMTTSYMVEDWMSCMVLFLSVAAGGFDEFFCGDGAGVVIEVFGVFGIHAEEAAFVFDADPAGEAGVFDDMEHAVEVGLLVGAVGVEEMGLGVDAFCIGHEFGDAFIAIVFFEAFC